MLSKTPLPEIIIIDSIYTLYYQEKPVDFFFPGEIHQFWELIYVDKGNICLLLDGKEFLLSPGDLLFYSENQNHVFWSDKRTAPNFLTISFDMSFTDRNFYKDKIFSTDKRIKEIFADILRIRSKAFEGDIYTHHSNVKENSELLRQYIKVLLTELMLYLYVDYNSKNMFNVIDMDYDTYNTYNNDNFKYNNYNKVNYSKEYLDINTSTIDNASANACANGNVSANASCNNDNASANACANGNVSGNASCNNDNASANACADGNVSANASCNNDNASANACANGNVSGNASCNNDNASANACANGNVSGNACTNSNAFANAYDLNFLVKKSISYIQTNITNKIYIDEICSHVAVSRSYFTRLFRKNTGISVIKYINIERLKKAKQLLRESNASITSISYLLGFSSVYYFSNLFSKEYGISPLEYRKSINLDIRKKRN